MVKEIYLSGTTLPRPYPSRRFYIKIDWSKDKILAVLLKSDDSEEARKSEAQENYGRKCEFDKSLEEIRLEKFILS